MIKGTYIFYEDGLEIYRSENLITKFGKRFITNYLAGNVAFVQKDIAIGVATDIEYPISSSNSRLGFEFYRLPVSYSGIDIRQNVGVVDENGNPGFLYSVVYKTTLPQDVAGRINEIGLYPGKKTSDNNYDSKFVTDFENNTVWFDSSLYNPTIVSTNNPRIGSYLLKWTTAGASTSKEYKSSINTLDISGYSVYDSITLAFNQADANLASLKVRFYSSDTAYFESTITTTATTGNKIQSVTLNSMLTSPVNNPDSTSISKIGIIATSGSGGAATVYLDGLRINDEDTFDPTYGMISRSALSTELVKLAGRQVDIEYRLDLSI